MTQARAIGIALFLTLSLFTITYSASAASTLVIPRNYELYSSGPSVLLLQKFLNAHGYLVAQTGAGSPGHETSFFGNLTYKALKKFQATHDLPSTGFLGPLTRALIAGISNTSNTTTGTGQSGTTSVITQPTGQSTSGVNTSTTIIVTTPVMPPVSHGSVGGVSSSPAPVNATPPAILSVPTSTLNFFAAQGSAATSSQSVILKNGASAGSITLDWSATSTQAWVTFNASSGILAGGATTSLSFIVNPTGKTIGTYNATATISDPNASNSPQVIPVSLTINSTGVSATITSPTNGATVYNTVSLTATATSSAGIASVQFYLDGSPFGSAVTSSPYTVSWNTASSTNTSHTLSAVATDNLSNTATSTSISVTVDNTAPIISSLATTTLSPSSILVSWTTNKPADSLVDYGANTSYGSSTYSATATTTHAVILTNLSTSTPPSPYSTSTPYTSSTAFNAAIAYHFFIQSTAANSKAASSSDQTLPVAGYYVDSVNGNDTNNGLSASAAVKTIAKISALDASSSLNTWYLADNSDWQEEITIPRNGVTIEAYGTGTMPLLDASSPITANSWATTTFSNVYKATLSINCPSGQCYLRLWENSSTLTRASASSTMTPGTFYVPVIGTPTNGLVTFYVDPTSSSTNPMTAGDGYYWYNPRENGIGGQGAGTNWTIEGIRTRRPSFYGGGIVAGEYATLIDDEVDDGIKHSLEIAPGAYVNGLTLNGAYDDLDGANPLILFQGDATTTNYGLGYGLNNVSIFATTPNSVWTAGDAVYGHCQPGPCSLGTITFNNLYVNGMDAGVEEGGGGLATIINSSTLTNMITAVGPTGNNFTISNSTLSCTSSCIDAGSGTTTITNSTITGFTLLGGNLPVVITSSTLINGGIHLTQGTSSTLTANNNDFSNSTNLIYDLVSPYTYTGNYNNFGGGTQVFSVNGGATDIYFPAWKTLTGQDSSSTPLPPVGQLIDDFNLTGLASNATSVPNSASCCSGLSSMSLTGPYTISATSGISFATSTGAGGNAVINQSGLQGDFQAGGDYTVMVVMKSSFTTGGQWWIGTPFEMDDGGSHAVAKFVGQGDSPMGNVVDGNQFNFSIPNFPNNPDPNYHMVTFTMTSSTMTGWLDTTQGSSTTLTNPTQPNFPPPSIFWVGNTTADNSAFDGSIAYVRVYNEALSNSQVQTVYSQLKSILSGEGITMP